MKKFLIAGVAAATVAGGAFAFANSLSVSTQDLASGTSPVADGCESVAVNWTTAYDTNKYELDDINLSFAGSCNGRDYKVTVADNAGVALDSFTQADGAIATLAATIEASDDNIDASQVGNITVVVVGPAAVPAAAD